MNETMSRTEKHKKIAQRRKGSDKVQRLPENFSPGSYFELNIDLIDARGSDEFKAWAAKFEDEVFQVVGFAYNDYKQEFVVYFDCLGAADKIYERWVTFLD